MVFIITQEREKCIGCRACVALCPDNWKIDGDGKASPKKTKLESIGCNQRAADGCPVKIIHVKKE